MNQQLPRNVAKRLLAALGTNISNRRKQLGWSQERLSAQSNIHRAYLCDIERGKRNPGILNVARIAGALGLSVASLCSGIDEFQTKSNRVD